MIINVSILGLDWGYIIGESFEIITLLPCHLRDDQDTYMI